MNGRGMMGVVLYMDMPSLHTCKRHAGLAFSASGMNQLGLYYECMGI